MSARSSKDEVGRRAGSGANHSTMRGVNRSLVLDLIKYRGPVSRATVAKVASLAKPTVSAIVDDLLTEGVVREIGHGRSSEVGGRPPMLLEFNARSRFVVGVHIGVQRTNVLVGDATGAEIGRVSRPTPKARPREALRRVAGLVSDALEEVGAARKRVAAVGVCVPGMVDMRTGTCLLAPNLGWKDVPVSELLEAELDVPIAVHNTTQAAAVAETVEGAARGSTEVVLLYAGTGVGAGVLSDGRLFHGADGFAGEIGHCVIPGATERCNCGKVGCLETVASAPAIARAAARGRTTPTAVDVAEAAASGDERARTILGDAGKWLGWAASTLVNLFNPQTLVVAGGLVGAGEPLLGPLREAVAEHALPESRRRVEVRTWALGQDAKVRGAVLVALQHSETYYRVIFQG